MKKLAIYSLIAAGLLPLIIGCGKERNIDTSSPPSLTQKSVTLTVTKILKSIDYTHPNGITSYGLPNRPPEIGHPGAMLIVYTALTSEFDALIDSSNINYTASLKDNLGKEITGGGSGYTIVGGVSYLSFYGRYSPQAKSFNLSCLIVSSLEADCDTIDFSDVSLESKHLSRTVGNKTITVERMEVRELGGAQSLFIYVQLSQKPDVKQIGIKEVIDNLGNRYQQIGSGTTEKERSFQFNDFNPGVTSIRFKYLIARDSLSFEFKNLPMP